jgi:hypothetical protein
MSSPKRALGRLQPTSSTKQTQDRPKTAQERLKTPPRRPKIAQDRPRPPKTAPRPPKTAPRPPKTVCCHRLLRTFLTRWLSLSLRCLRRLLLLPHHNLSCFRLFKFRLSLSLSFSLFLSLSLSLSRSLPLSLCLLTSLCAECPATILYPGSPLTHAMFRCATASTAGTADVKLWRIISTCAMLTRAKKGRATTAATRTEPCRSKATALLPAFGTTCRCSVFLKRCVGCDTGTT